MIQPYDSETESLLQLQYSRLLEKEKRHFAALEVIKLGRGGQIYVRKLLNVSQKTIEKGIRELKNTSFYSQIPKGKQRRKGGGRKKILQTSSS